MVSKQIMLVHGNWTYLGTHQLSFGKKISNIKNFKSWTTAKKFANSKAKQLGIKEYPVHLSTGDVKWVKTK